MYQQTVDGLPCRLAAPFDLSFLSCYGRVFRVFDDQDSGNLCFGAEKDGRKYFLKFAGAPTARYPGTPREAIARLGEAEAVYRDLRHPNLIPYLGATEAGGGYLLLFDWVEGACMGKQYPESRALFMTLPMEERALVLDCVLDFLIEVHHRGYVAVDMYDGSLLYDFDAKKAWLCDVDFFRKKPFVNPMGRLWGSSRFMAPEEFTLGAPIDEVTNVFLAGAFAFALAGGETVRSQRLWRLSEGKYRAALQAVSPAREDRPQTLTAFRDLWNRG